MTNVTNLRRDRAVKVRDGDQKIVTIQVGETRDVPDFDTKRPFHADLIKERSIEVGKGGQKALELEADILMKATRVDGVYSDDPEKNPHAVFYRDLTFEQVRNQNLRVMDPTAIAHCMEHNLPILVFNYRTDGNIEKAVRGEAIGTRVTSGKNN